MTRRRGEKKAKASAPWHDVADRPPAMTGWHVSMTRETRNALIAAVAFLGVAAQVLWVVLLSYPLLYLVTRATGL